MLALFRCEQLIAGRFQFLTCSLLRLRERLSRRLSGWRSTERQPLCGSERLAEAWLDQVGAFSAGPCHVRGIAGRFQFLSSALRDAEIVTVALGG